MPTTKKVALTEAELDSRREVVRAIARTHENGTLQTPKPRGRTAAPHYERRRIHSDGAEDTHSFLTPRAERPPRRAYPERPTCQG